MNVKELDTCSKPALLSLSQIKIDIWPWSINRVNWDLRLGGAGINHSMSALNREMILLTCRLSQIYFPINAARQSNSQGKAV